MQGNPGKTLHPKPAAPKHGKRGAGPDDKKFETFTTKTPRSKPSNEGVHLKPRPFTSKEVR